MLTSSGSLIAETQGSQLHRRDERWVGGTLTVGRVIERFHMAKHFELTITDTSLSWRRKDEAIKAEAALDGLYVIRTSLGAAQLDANAAVAAYKSLAHVERAFRSMKTVDLNVRPVFHYSEPRVRAHVFLCMLAYYVEWAHARSAQTHAVRRRAPRGGQREPHLTGGQGGTLRARQDQGCEQARR
jgi:hypothetical protein